ncbi:MAG: rare lipoprotein A [Deltaproteobacteria bacterium ADurb.Bin510]|nr:MAG: rare lipoprotein A [Deltaproteobacteria bacterium ADurb.Bin510]
MLCLGVACFLSFMVSRNHQLAFNPFDGQPQVKAAVIPPKPRLAVKLPEKPRPADPSPEKLTFYDILGQKGNAAMPEVEQYAIQIAAFQTEDRAQAYADELKAEKRLNCRVDKTETLACVRWGTFTSKAGAEHYLKRIADTVGKDCLVVRM